MTPDAAFTTELQFRLPDLGEGVAETEIVRWLVEPGQRVAEDEPMVEVMTDKATVEIPAPAAGIIDDLVAAAGDVVLVGSVIVTMTTDTPVAGVGSARANTRSEGAAAGGTSAGRRAVAPSAGSGAGGPASGRPVQATPLVRKLAASLDVELAAIVGTGAGGRIIEQDVRGTAASAGAGVPSVTATAGVLREGVQRVVPLQGIRRQIADHLTRAAAVPTVTVVEEVDLTAADAARAAGGPSLLAQVSVATIGALRALPEMNAHMDSAAGELVVFDPVHLGVAVQTDTGLVVPVVRDAHDCGAAELDARVGELADRVRNGKAAPGELRGSTFTITSAGKLGGLFTTPLLNVPEVGILGIHRAEERAVVRDGEVVVRRMANLSVTFDHRALDGIQASRFILDVIARLQA